MIYLIAIFTNVLLYVFYKKREKKVFELKNKASLFKHTSKIFVEEIIKKEKLKNVKQTEYKKNYYDWKTKTIHIEQDVYHENTIYGIAVSSHECGHAVQHEKMTFLSILRIITLIVRNIAFLILLIILILNMIGKTGLEAYFFLAGIGITSYYLTCLFHEWEANQFAVELIEKFEIEEEEKKLIKEIQKKLMGSYAVNLLSCFSLLIVILSSF